MDDPVARVIRKFIDNSNKWGEEGGEGGEGLEAGHPWTAQGCPKFGIQRVL